MQTEKEGKSSLFIKRRVVALGFVFIALLALLFYRLYQPPDVLPPSIRKIESIHGIVTPQSEKVPYKIPEPAPSADTTGNNFSAGALRLLENLNCYLNSAMRETGQCKAIAKIVSQHNLAPDSVKDAYNLAWHAQSLANRIELEADLTKASLESVQDMLVHALVHAFSVKYGVTNASFFIELLAIKPTAHFGYCGFSQQLPNALTAKFAQLTNPNLFPEFNLGSNWFLQRAQAAEEHYQMFASQEAEMAFFRKPEVEPIRSLLTEYGAPKYRFPELLRYAVEDTQTYHTLYAHVEEDQEDLDKLSNSTEHLDQQEAKYRRETAEIFLQSSALNAENFMKESITMWMYETGITDGRFFDRLFSIVITSSIPRLPSFADLSPDLERLVGPGLVPIQKMDISIEELLKARP
jgi:hypothetical protein